MNWFNRINMSENASFVRFRCHHLQDERKSSIRCTVILSRIMILNVSSSCTALGVPERANLLSNSWKNRPGMVLSIKSTGDNLQFTISASPTSSTLTRPMSKLSKQILRPSLQELLSDQQRRACVGLQASMPVGETGFSSLTTQTMST